MSTTVTYKGSTLTTVENETRTLTTRGKYLEDNITLVDETVPFEPELQTKSETYTPTTSQQTESITADVGYDALERVNVTINAVATAEYSVDIGNNDEFYNDGANRKYRLRPYLFVDEAGWVSSDTAGVWKNYSAVPSGTTITPTESAQTVGGTKHMMEGAVTVSAIPSNYVGSGITQRSSSDLTASGATVTVPSGYYSAQASKAVASGTAGTPTATKGTVSNHSVSVTPSVTNQTGYITGSTKTGTAVTVSASELVSGSQTITSNQTVDVTNLAEVVVNVSGGGGASSWTKVAETSYQANTTDTYASTVATWETGHSEIWTSSKWVYVRVRDTAGKRNGYFYGSDNFFINRWVVNGAGNTNVDTGIRYTLNYASNGTYGGSQQINTTGYGVYADNIYSDGSVRIRQRYHSSSSLTINSTYKVEVYLLDPAGGVPIFE